MIRVLGILVGLAGLAATVLAFTGIGSGALQDLLASVPFYTWPIVTVVGFALAMLTRRPAD